MLLFTDESSKDDKTVSWRWGYSRIGSRCYSHEPFVRGKHYTILPLLSIDGYLACEVFEGSVTGKMFEKFLLTHVVCPCHAPVPRPCSVLVLDNCAIHHGPAVRDIIEGEAGMSCLPK
ncbi:hypothetical protein BS47DRAFT_1309906 [Hydnum rufescens UP504]|uniref:Tc1-like transposase DDE domain-containing protein n=1 Tax=Hydnum rufescens UP504 TaxID=1448309 RepID=A0A9P6ACS6_9AGAM|nr:hypothetical protein BS47DRAFT_1309906 [Hydnum rufescens UP504]